MTMRIIHVMRSPVGGLFRHVLDLSEEQARRGHAVGIVCDSTTGGASAAERLHEMSGVLTLGVKRIPMPRLPGLGDLSALKSVADILQKSKPDVVHGHGAKGGLYARLVRAPKEPAQTLRRVYTPHGGSLHYSWSSVSGALFLTAERLLSSRTSTFIFECAFSRDSFVEKIGKPSSAMRVVHNGLKATDFNLAPRDEDATDFLFIGELRMLKGLDVLLKAMEIVKAESPFDPTLTVVGDGPDAAELKTMAAPLGNLVRFLPPEPAMRAFRRARCAVVPSRKEAFPYVVLEAISSNRPLIASNVGGISEITGPQSTQMLVRADDPHVLAHRMTMALHEPATLQEATVEARTRLHAEMTVERMTDGVMAAYMPESPEHSPLTPHSSAPLSAS